MPTNIPPLQFTSAGAVAPTEAAILAGAQQDLDDAFGAALNPSLETPQGQIASTETAVVAQANANLVYIASQMDPAYATGRFQDAIGRIYFLTRNPALPTTVTCTVTGLAGTVLPANTQAVATDGSIYLLTADTTIPAGGSIDVSFAAQVAGPTACPAGSLNAIYRAVPGWDTVTNAADGVLGQNVESRYAFEERRQQSVAANSQGMLASVLGSVLDVSGVSDAYATQNNTASPVTITGVTIAANSIYVCVSGGVNEDIAAAILLKKMPGCVMTGATSVVVTDTNPLFATPYPTYTVKFQTAAALTIKFAVTISNSAQVPSNASTLVENAIIAAFAGADGGQRARIGSTVYASRFYSAVAALGPWANIVSILVGTSTATLNSVLVPIDSVPVVSAADITVTLA